MLMADHTLRVTGSPPILGSGSVVFTSNAASAAVTDVLDISQGLEHLCYIRGADGAVFCGGHNSVGQVGNGIAVGSFATTPVQVTFPPGIGRATRIVTGQDFSCAVAQDLTSATPKNDVLCWGANDSGQLGNGTTTASSDPVFASVGLMGPVTVGGGEIAAGAHFACAVLQEGVPVCWGNNVFGQIGDGTTTNALSAVPILSPAVIGLSLGAQHSCSLQVTGTVRCWGENNEGQIGDGTFTQRDTPTPVVGLTDAVQIAAGIFSTCALRTNGTVVCWGVGAHGELGNGDTQIVTSPVPAIGLSGVMSIGSTSVNAYAILQDQRVFGWGFNNIGQLGNGTTITQFIPVQVIVQ
jgi:alpha-tubulin suppressor-like RCC1 family protein